MESLKEIKKIVDAGGDPNALVGGASYIHLCINENDSELISYLIKKGCDPNTPQCTALPHPLHYAIGMKCNDSLMALLASEKVDPNLKTPQGVPALIFAVKKNNREAVKILLEFDANPNVTNASGEIALFHAINQGDISSVATLLDYQSDMVVGQKSALHFAIKLGQTECVRLLLANKADRTEPDINGRLPIDIAMNLEDPTIELMLYSPGIPPSTMRKSFVKYLYETIEVKEVETVRDIMMKSPTTIPKDIFAFIERIKKAERCHNRFLQFLKQRIDKLNDLIDKLSNPGREFLDKDINKLSKQLRNSFIKRIDDSTQHQKELEDSLMTPFALSHFNKWKGYSSDMLGFIDGVIEEGLLKFGMKDDAVKTLEMSKKEVIKVMEINKAVTVKTLPFQTEIADFIDVTVRKLKEINMKGLNDVKKHFKGLIRQIEETNPELIKARFKRR